MRAARPLLLGLLVAALFPAAPARAAEWLAGDGHVHTCYSHDSYCLGDDNTGPDTFYSSGGTVGQRFGEAAAKGLDFLVISDHDDVRAWSDPAFGSQGVLGVRAYEHSLAGGLGHAHVLGAPGTYGDLEPELLAEQVRADGGLFQANHPTYKGEAPLTGCEDVASGGPATHWRLGFRVRPDAVEVWNPTALIPPAEVFWECWLQHGWRLPATAGSDSHGATQPTLGLPTLWVLARDRSPAAVLDAIRAGRTTISRLPPALGGATIVLEADADRDGTYEATVGDSVRPGTPMRVRSQGLSAAGTVRIRANGADHHDAVLLPGASVGFRAPRDPGWVRATLVQPQLTADADPNCTGGGPAPAAGFDLCTSDLAYTAMTSPVYVERPGERRRPTSPPRGAAPTRGSGDEPDDDAPMPPAAHSGRAERLPAIGAPSH
jgi:Protein of unknown function (DUF3604)